MPSRQSVVRLTIALLNSLLLLLFSLLTLSHTRAFDEERDLLYYEPLVTPRTYYSPSVSSVHFDLVGALAIAAGFSVTDAATIQIYSQLTDSGLLPEEEPKHAFHADPANYPTPPPFASIADQCPSETVSTTATIGNYEYMSDLMECPGCFTSRFGPYGVFFHFPHDRADELGAIRKWALGRTPTLTGMVVYGYSSTARSTFQEIANVYATTSCFITGTATVDTGGITSGSLEAFGMYLHSLGDHWSHQACIQATDSQGKPFAAHVTPDGPADPLWPCRWPSHSFEFGHPLLFPDSNRTFSGTLALYDDLTAYAAESGRAVYRSIAITAENNYLYNSLYDFAHGATASQPQYRRDLADQIYQWSLQTRARPEYRIHRLLLPTVVTMRD